MRSSGVFAFPAFVRRQPRPQRAVDAVATSLYHRCRAVDAVADVAAESMLEWRFECLTEKKNRNRVLISRKKSDEEDAEEVWKCTVDYTDKMTKATKC